MNNTSAERRTRTAGVVFHALRYPRVLSIASFGGPLNHGYAPEPMRL